ncbi:glycine oxidase ThiO [Paenibacillus sp. 481]|uniref:glycine oxidase ThiO n=1 Tax=Paenibacillus sp. 481 TaxID=2835869 RepID=UPI001E3006ED|nr:glycine oxidase ThiO [Paenibacillus sp. 481]UHA73112.1 glycine oxidase ThiO [Paenibacillus sp. 481]
MGSGLTYNGKKVNSSDVVVVGGGVIGCSVAYELSKRGVRVTLLEKGTIGSGSSCAAAGMLAPVAERIAQPELAQFACLSKSLFPSWTEELWECAHVDVELRLRGLLIPVATNENVQQIEAQLHAAAAFADNTAAASSHWLASDLLARLYPALHDSLAGAFYVEEGHVMPTLLMQALATSARLHGAQLLEHRAVVRLLHEQGRVVGVETMDGVWHADHVVICSGLESAMFTQSFGLDLPLHAVQGELVVVQSHNIHLEQVVYGAGTYIVPKGNGYFYIGATSNAHCYDHHVRALAVQRLIEQATAYVPSIADARFVEAWAGLRPCTPDELPYIGPVEDIEGLWMASGHYRNGILLSAATAQGVAQWLLAGAAKEHMPWEMLAAFSPDRQHSKSIHPAAQMNAEIRMT